MTKRTLGSVVKEARDEARMELLSNVVDRPVMIRRLP